MIQRFTVPFQGVQHLPQAREAIREIGFPDGAVRVWENEDSGWVNIHAYRDGDVDDMQRLNPDYMEDYCVEVWSRIGYAPCILTEFGDAEGVVEFGEREHQAWLEG